MRSLVYSMGMKEPENNIGKLPKQKRYVYPNGKHGNFATVRTMIKVARKYSGHPLVRKLAVNILNHYGTSSHNHLDEARAIGEYVKNKVKYAKDPHQIEYLMEPTTLIKEIQKGEARGDCDDMAALAMTLLLSIGIQPHVCIVRYKSAAKKGIGGYQHVYVCVYEHNHGDRKVSRLVLDCILKHKSIGYEVDYDKKKEFPA